MEFLTYLVDFILHIDAHLFELVEQYGMWIYAILFIIVFCETGLVVTPFLPGDSLLLPPVWWPVRASWATVMCCWCCWPPVSWAMR